VCPPLQLVPRAMVLGDEDDEAAQSYKPPLEYLPESGAVPLKFPQLKDFNSLVYVKVDVRGPNAQPPDERYIEVVPVDGANGPVKLLAEGAFQVVKHPYRRNQNTGRVQNSAWLKTNGIIDVPDKRWLCMSISEKETWLHVIARANWWRRGMFPSGHPEYRDRSFAGGPLPETEIDDEELPSTKEVVPKHGQWGATERQLRLMCGQPRSRPAHSAGSKK